MPRSISLAAILTLWLGAASLAGEPADTARPCPGCAAAPCCCPDDYCRKPFPCIPCPPARGCVDDYCKKPSPCIPCPPARGCVDDYCKKPFPDLCRPLNRQFFRCPLPDLHFQDSLSRSR